MSATLQSRNLNEARQKAPFCKIHIGRINVCTTGYYYPSPNVFSFLYKYHAPENTSVEPHSGKTRSPRSEIQNEKMKNRGAGSPNFEYF